MKNLFVLVLVVGVHLAYADTYPRNGAIDIKHYFFQFELNDTTNVIAGNATVRIYFHKQVTDFELDLVKQNSAGKGMKVHEVLQNGKPIKFSHENNRLKISPPPFTPNATLDFVIRYSGIPLDGLIIGKNKFGDRTFFGDNWPDRARNWYPCIDHPYEKAGVDFSVTAPAHYSVVANGIKLEESYLNDQQKLTHWHEEADISTKVMVIGVARFAIQNAGSVNHIPIENWVYPQDRAAGFFDFAPAPAILEYFQTKIGPYSYKKLANVQSSTIMGGMENASNIFYPESFVAGKRKSDNTVVHEIAHQWFGNSATESDWSEVWLSEGFATYFTHTYNESTYGKEKMRKDLIQDRKDVIAHCKASPAPIIDKSITDYMNLLSPHIYSRASWVLHMLRVEMGDQAFWGGVREYYKQYQNKNTTTANLQAIMEAASGKDLDTFFQQWLQRAEIPSLKVDWTFNPKSNKIDLAITQTQAGQPFKLILEVGLYDENGSVGSVEKIEIDQKTHKISLPVPQKPLKIALDPNANLLFEEILKN
jgi:aminopeptidase N